MPRSIRIPRLKSATRVARIFNNGDLVFDITTGHLYVGDGATPGGLKVLKTEDIVISPESIQSGVRDYLTENPVVSSWSDLVGKPDQFPPEEHEHEYAAPTHDHAGVYALADHVHESVSGDAWSVVKLAEDFTKSTTANDAVTGFNFTPGTSKTYLIFGYFLLRTATATVGARPGIAWPGSITDGIARMEAANSLTGSAIRTWGAKSILNAASTGLASTADSHWGSLDCLLITGPGTTGNFQITLASETAGTNVTMKAGSVLMYREV